MAVLRWHVDTQLATPEQQDSEPLLSAVNGKFRSPSVLNKPLEKVGLELCLKKKNTQRALRRTFNDLARAAQVNDLVTRSISGHQTEKMQQHYSTVSVRTGLNELYLLPVDEATCMRLTKRSLDELKRHVRAQCQMRLSGEDVRQVVEHEGGLMRDDPFCSDQRWPRACS